MRRSRFPLWAGAAAFAAIAWLAFAHWTPSGAVESSLCLFRRHTHLACPGCGLTRAFTLMAQGDLAAAVRMHPLAPLLAAEGVLLWLLWGILIVRGKALAAERWELPLALVHLALFGGLWLYRLAAGTLPS